MADRARQIFKAVIAKIKANSALNTAVGGRVYTDVPDNATYPFMHIELETSDNGSFNTNDTQNNLTINVYSTKSSPDQALDIRSKLYDLFHEEEAGLTLDSGSVRLLRFSGTSVILKAPDLKSWQATIIFNLLAD